MIQNSVIFYTTHLYLQPTRLFIPVVHESHEDVQVHLMEELQVVIPQACSAGLAAHLHYFILLYCPLCYSKQNMESLKCVMIFEMVGDPSCIE